MSVYFSYFLDYYEKVDKTLPYGDIIMKAPMKKWSCPVLSDDYRFKSYEKGDEEAWASLETSVGEFKCIEDARLYFNNTFMPYPAQLSQRMFFIVDEQDKICATASAWFKEDETRHYAVLHWVSVANAYQGKGLGKAIVGYALHQFPKIEPSESEIFLHTQTWSYNALGIYARYGFKITQEPLVHVHTDMNCLPLLDKLIPQRIMDNLVE